METEEPEVAAAAEHILVLLDDVQERLAAIRSAAERLVKQQESNDAAQP
jgi:hypothetical protein